MHAALWLTGFACGLFIGLHVARARRIRRARHKAVLMTRRGVEWSRRRDDVCARRAVEISRRVA